MDRCARYADANLIGPKRRGGSVFNPKHSRRFSEFVVDDSSHMNLSGYRRSQWPATEGRQVLLSCEEPKFPVTWLTGVYARITGAIVRNTCILGV